VRILWISDSPQSPSGFAAVTGAVCRRLAERGHRVDILGWQTHGAMSRWEGIPVHPIRRDSFGSDVIQGYLLRLQPQLLVTLADVWWMTFLADPVVQRYLDQSGARWVLYYPIDGATPGGRLPSGWVRVLQAADVPVAMSRFGALVSEASGVPAAYIPHGVDLEVFSPPEDKRAAKARFGYEDRFVVLSDARNQPRKLLPRTLDVAAAFAAGKRDVVVHLHCDPDDDAAGSDLYRYRLRDDIAAMGVSDVVRLTERFRMRSSGGLPFEELAALYRAADVHLLCSWGEGFGLPNLQACAAGVVPVAGRFAASQELVEGHGVAVPPESSMVDEFGLERWLVDVDEAAAALDRLYRDPDELIDRSRRARGFALSYSWDGVVDRWEQLLAAAPPRRRPVRSRRFTWIAGPDESPPQDMPAPVVTAVSDAFATLADGTTVQLQVTERQYGELAAQIRREAFVEGEELSIPVRLPPCFPGAPRPVVGNVLVGPASLPLAVLLRRIFPGLQYSVPRPGGDPASDVTLPLELLAPALARCVLVIDQGQDAAPGIDLLAAALGVPYLGPSPLWPPIGADTPVRRARRLLTDQGLSDRRRSEALAAATAAYGGELVEKLRALVGSAEHAGA
jgi:glycosyltransferase involved in cell wall biosynthesis